MPEPLKNLFSRSFVNELSLVFSKCVPGFNKKKFTADIFDDNWEQEELKQRMRHITIALHTQMPEDFPKASKLLTESSTLFMQKHGEGLSFLHMFLPDYIELYGIDHLKEAIKTFDKVTRFTSAEFAVRPFIIKYPKEMMAQMLIWSTSNNPYVRRLSSEGSRPRLPWAIALPAFKKDPAGILPILENLKNDAAETVRKSVANNINDISKDNPDIVMQLIAKWKGQNANTDRILKHGARTLLKNGHENALDSFGWKVSSDITISQFKLSPASINLGDSLSFTFQIENNADKQQLLRIDYAVYYVKAQKKSSRKVFRLTEKEFPPISVFTISKKQRFIDFTTRTHHAGKHEIAIIVNGKEMAKKSFLLTR